MENKNFRKGLVLAIVILFIGMSTISVVESLSIEKQAIQESLPFTYSTKDTLGISLITIQVGGEPTLNNWYASDVTFNFAKKSDDIASIYYNINDNNWNEYIEPFVVHNDGERALKWYAINYEGNTSEVDGPFFFNIDQTKPEIYLEYEVTGGDPEHGWEITFTATATDSTSDMDYVEFYLDHVLQSTVYGPGPTYIWVLKHYKPPHYSFGAAGYDKAGNSAWDEIISSDNLDVLKSSISFSDISKETNAQSISNDVLSSEIVELENQKIIEKLPSVYTNEDVFDPTYIIVVCNRIPGGNGWIVSNASIPIFYESDRIADVFYQINDGGWKVYTEPLIISDDGVYVFSWYAVDSEGYTSTPESTTFKIDQTSPKITLVKERIDDKHIKFIANVIDGMSGVWKVNFYLDNQLVYNDIDFPFEWIWNITDNHIHTLKAIVYDMAGNSASNSINTPHIKSQSQNNFNVLQNSQNLQIIKLFQNLILHYQIRICNLRGR